MSTLFNHYLKRSWLTTVFTKLSGILCTALAFPRTVILLHSSIHVHPGHPRLHSSVHVHSRHSGLHPSIHVHSWHSGLHSRCIWCQCRNNLISGLLHFHQFSFFVTAYGESIQAKIHIIKPLSSYFNTHSIIKFIQIVVYMEL